MLVAEAFTIDVSQIIGGAGTGIGGFLAGLLYKAYKTWVAESKLRAVLIKAQIQELKEMKGHREAEATHWGTTINHYADTMKHREAEETSLKALADDVRVMRVRYETGPQKPIQAVDTSPISVG